MHINSVLSTYFWGIKVRTFLLLDFQVFTACFLLRCPEYLQDVFPRCFNPAPVCFRQYSPYFRSLPAIVRQSQYRLNLGFVLHIVQSQALQQPAVIVCFLIECVFGWGRK